MEQRTPATRIAEELLTVRRAFGEPVERDGTTLVPVARVTGGAGSGYGSGTLDGGTGADRGTHGQGEGTGGGDGYGVRVRPLGVYAVRGDQVRWEPALDLQRVILGGQALVAVAVLAIAWAARRRRR